jgi:rhomboid protease GluP
VVTAIVTGLDLLYPRIGRARQRTPAAIGGESWRLISPILVNPEGWKQIATNLLGLSAAGVLVERQWGPRWWLVFYITGGIVGQIAGLAWQPVGAGSSVAVCGLLGAISVSLVRTGTNPGRFGGALMLAGALLLTYLHDLHGPPILAAAVLAALAAVVTRPRRA